MTEGVAKPKVASKVRSNKETSCSILHNQTSASNPFFISIQVKQRGKEKQAMYIVTSQLELAFPKHGDGQ